MTFAQPFQDYEILDRVGAGAMGTVFKARHKKLNRIVALKVLKPSLARDERYVDRLRREARIVASLNDPHIVTGYDLGEEGGYHYFVMEFVEGKSLRALLSEWGMVAEEYVRRVARQVAHALDHAYQRGVIHRDVKPGNILIDEAGNVKLTDMGLAKGPADLTLTRDGATVGTPQYISPEQARNPQDVDVRSDLYSLGATLYHMATGIPPFQGDTMAELITNVLNETPVSPLAINPALSEGLSLVIRKLLVKDLRVRYQTPRELLDDLDRIDRSLPPEVDVARLSDDKEDTSRWLVMSLVVVALAVLLGGAWWLGMQARGPDVTAPTGDEFLARLDAELQALPTPGERFERLVALGLAPPPDTATRVEQRKRAAMAELQANLNATVATLLEADWAHLEVWLRDPTVWPDRARCLRERIQPRLRERVGVVLGQLPVNVRTERLDELLKAIDQCIADRDATLLVQFDHFLASTLPAAVEERVRAGHFAAADRLWKDAIHTFCDHVRQPLFEYLSEHTARRMREKHVLAENAARPALTTQEIACAQAMRGEVAATVEDLTARLAAGLSPETTAQRLLTFRRDFLQVWPAAGRFRLGNEDPWPDIERQLGVLQQAIHNAEAQRAQQRFEARCDLAWRTFCHGSPDDALRVLDETTEAAPHLQASLQQQREVLLAARAVAAAVVLSISRSGREVLAFPRGSHQTVALHTEAAGEGHRLLSTANLQSPRVANLAEFRCTDLLTRLRQLGVDPLQGVPPAQLSPGLAVLAMASDDLADLGVQLEALRRQDHAFLVDEVWPRIARVRGEQPERPLDRGVLFARMRQAREALSNSGSLGDLETAIMGCRAVQAHELSDAERLELRLAQQARDLERQRVALTAELHDIAPQGAGVVVMAAGDELTAEVRLSAAVLHSDAAEGWQVRQGALEFAGAGRPWSARSVQLLHCNPGLEPRWQRTEIHIDLVLPSSTVGTRLYEFEFRGIAVLLVVAANDSVHAAFVDGDPAREDHVQRAFERAMLGTLGQLRTMIVPGALHRLTIDVLAASAMRTRAAVRVLLDGTELVADSRDLDPLRAPELVLYPLQEVAVREVVVRAQRP